jgi:hypothetical protein
VADGEVEGAAAEAASSDGAPKKKRSRRGSRGGRRRRKPAADGEASLDGDPGTPEDVVAGEAADGYVPMSDWIEDFEATSS